MRSDDSTIWKQLPQILFERLKHDLHDALKAFNERNTHAGKALVKGKRRLDMLWLSEHLTIAKS